MDYMEVWFKIWCPKCEKPNWVCDGDPSDLTGVDIEAITCWHCKYSWWLDSDSVWEDMRPEDATPEEEAEEGMEMPR